MLLNRNLWKNAYLLEFYQNDILENAFTFSVPPQSEEFIYAQRVNETKTFGGSVFEDYGNDTVKINLSGTTINQELKLIYRGKKGNKYLSGEDEIFYLRNLLQEYGKFNKLHNKKVYLYQLVNKRNNTTKNYKNWQIWVEQFEIKRTKDKPFAYDYSLRCTGIPIEKTSKQIEFAKKIQEKIDEISKGFEEWYKNLEHYLNVEDVQDFIVNIKTSLEAIQEGYNYCTEWFNSGVSAISDIIKETSILGETFVNTLVEPVGNSSIFISLTELVKETDKLTSWFRKNRLGEEILNAANKIGSSMQDFNDACAKLTHKTSRDVQILYKDISDELSEHKQFPLIIPGGYGSDDTTMLANGYKEYSFKSGDTWASLAKQFYGEASYSTMLQFYNKDVALEEITAGTKIYIPIIYATNTNKTNNQVFSKYGIKEQLGADIKLKDGDFAVHNNDFALIKGVPNIEQAINNRLSTALNSRVRNVVYGIRNESGLSEDTKNAAATYITTSIEQTILQDPRVEKIEEITWQGSGEKLKVNVTYVTINGQSNTYKGEF